MGEQGRHGGRPAAEIVLLQHRSGQALRANAGDRNLHTAGNRRQVGLLCACHGYHGAGDGKREGQRQLEAAHHALRSVHLQVQNHGVLNQHVGPGVLDHQGQAAHVGKCTGADGVGAC